MEVIDAAVIVELVSVKLPAHINLFCWPTEITYIVANSVMFVLIVKGNSILFTVTVAD